MAQAAALVQAREPEPVQAQQLAAEQLERVQMQAQRLVSEPELELALGLQLEREPAVEPERVRELELV